MHARYFYALTLSFLAGVAARSIGLELSSSFMVLLGALSLLWVLLALFGTHRGRVSAMVALVSLGLLIGFWITAQDFAQSQMVIIDPLPDSEVELEGIVAEPVDTRQVNQKLTVDVDVIQHQGVTHEVSIRMLVTTERQPVYEYGDRLQITGKIKVPESFITDTGREFDYATYLWKDDIQYEVRYPEQIVLLETRQGNLIVALLDQLKRRLVLQINQLMHHPEAGLLAGELFGEKAALGGSLQDDFRKTGLIHVVVLSGYNVTLVAKFLLTIFALISVRLGNVLALAGIVAFAILTGGGPTVIRASIMAALVVSANMTGRDYLIARGLTLAAVIMVAINPRVLLFDIGFQLSFLATVGLVYVSPRLEPWLRWVPQKFAIRENLVATVSTQLFVLPLLVLYMGEVSAISVVTNVLVLGMVPVSMLLGFLAIVTSLVIPPLGLLVAMPAYLSLKYQVASVEWFARVPGAAIMLPEFSPWLVLLLYIPMVAWLVFTQTKAAPDYTSSWELRSSDVRS